MEDNFSTEVGVGWGAGEHGSGGNVSDGEQWGAADEASLTRTPPSPPAVRPRVPNRPGGWGPLF